jgi:hypothetical protein
LDALFCQNGNFSTLFYISEWPLLKVNQSFHLMSVSVTSWSSVARHHCIKINDSYRERLASAVNPLPVGYDFTLP